MAGGRPNELRRDLRLVDAVGIGLGAIIGAGLFVVTGVAAGVAGPAFVLSLAIAAVPAACNALSSAELAARFPQSGGTYEYGHRVLHPAVGFAAGWMFLASKLAAGGTVALGFGAYLSRLVPAVPPRVGAVGAAILLTVANLAGIQKAGRFNTAVVSVTVGTLLYFVVAGLPAWDSAHWSPFAPQGWLSVLEASALLFFAYTGYARLATLGEEVHEPRQTIPRAILLSVGIATVLYLAVGAIAVAAVGAPALAEGVSPLSRAAQASPWPGVPLAVGIGATTAMLGVLLSQVLGISRMMLAMARRGDLPARFEQVGVRGVPWLGVLFAGGAVTVVALLGTLSWVVSAATFTILVYYTVTNLASLRLAKEDRLYPRAVPVLGLATCLVLAGSLPWPTIAAGLGLLAVGFVLRALWRRLRPRGGSPGEDRSNSPVQELPQ